MWFDDVFVENVPEPAWCLCCCNERVGERPATEASAMTWWEGSVRDQSARKASDVDEARTSAWVCDQARPVSGAGSAPLPMS